MRYYEAARRHSDKHFPDPAERGRRRCSAATNDLLLSEAGLLDEGTHAEGQPFVEDHPNYGKVYRVGSPAEMMEVAKRENMLIYMPHPRSKGSTGYPDVIKDTDALPARALPRASAERWGMGLDWSETRLCEKRCSPCSTT